MVLVVLLSLLAHLTQHQILASTCDNTLPASEILMVQFTPTLPPQIAPVSTVYDAIVTSYLNVVNCDYVQVQNVDHNSAPTGVFNQRTTVPTLTMWRVGCMPQTTAITRRGLRGHLENIKTVSAGGLVGNMDTIATTHSKRANLVAGLILDMAEDASGGIDPEIDGMTVEAYRYLQQVNTALFAINLVNSGFPLNQSCQYLRDPTIAARLDSKSINSNQAADIVCFASLYGPPSFNMSNEQLLSDLAALQYAIQIGSGFSTDSQHLCDTMNLSPTPFLGIDGQSIYNFLCKEDNTTRPSYSTPPRSTLLTTAASVGMSTVIVSNATATGTGAVGTAASGLAGTGMESRSATVVHLPPSPTAPLYYPIWTTATRK